MYRSKDSASLLKSLLFTKFKENEDNFDYVNIDFGFVDRLKGLGVEATDNLLTILLFTVQLKYETICQSLMLLRTKLTQEADSRKTNESNQGTSKEYFTK